MVSKQGSKEQQIEGWGMSQLHVIYLIVKEGKTASHIKTKDPTSKGKRTFV